jgi:hypothetical protein
MDWKREAEWDLRCHAARTGSLQSMREHLAALREQAVAIRSGPVERVQGGARAPDDRLTDNMVKCERLAHTYHATKRLVELGERGLSQLSPEERRVLELFYIARVPGHVERLMDELHIEQSQVYRLKDAALHKFALAMYGLAEY